MVDGERRDDEEGKRAERTLRRRRQIIDAATSVMERDGFHRTSMAAVAEAAGISVGLIYQYVEDKDALLQLVLTDVLDDFRAVLPAATEGVQDPIERLFRVYSAYSEVVARRRKALLLAYRESGTLTPAGRREVMDAERSKLPPFVTALEEGVERDLLVVEDPRLVAYTLIMSAHAWALKNWYLRDLVSFEEYQRHQFALVLRGLLTPPARERYAHLV